MENTAKAHEILALSRKFMDCRVLLTGAELNIFQHLAQPATARELAGRQGWHERPLAVLLDALTAMELLVKTDSRYRTDSDLLPYLSPDSPQSVLPMVRHAATIWKNWSNLTRIVAETGGIEGRPASFDDPEDRKAFIGAMHVIARELAPKIVRAIPDLGARRLLDVGGGSGTYTIAFLEAFPDMSATLFDLPEVVEMARQRIGEAGLTERVTIQAGDFYKDPLPRGHDLAILSAIIHMNSPEQNRALYQKILNALDPGGRIVIRDHVMQPDRTAPKSGALFAINMLVGTPGGGTYTFEEIEEGLLAAGFENVQLIQETDRMMGLVQAGKPL
ncbi:MAG: methyltransferase [Desulfosarcinaceae bacterium]